ncbi:MAG: glycosyltransferase [Lachnospiraceae bacterium]|nr:glycosyltransferase [Lachnospiraceae bacterium]
MEQPRLTHVISAVDQDPRELAARMHLAAEAVIVNQCGRDGREEFEFEGNRIRVVFDSARGVGRSRNQGMLLADTDLVLIGDEDIIYEDGYAETVIRTFEAHPEADILLFNVEQSEGRKTYHNGDYARVRFYNSGRYPAYSIAYRTGRQREAGVWFSLLFGGGAPYLAGEDSLFLMDSLKKGLKIYRTPQLIGRETARQSTWFTGFDDRFFRDRGRLYRSLYGRFAPLFTIRYLLKNRKEWLAERSFADAWRLMREGMR